MTLEMCYLQEKLFIIYYLIKVVHAVKFVLDNMKKKTGKFDEETFREVLKWYKPIYPNVPNLRDLILHEYGGWEKFPNHTEETSVLERYTKMESDIVFVAPMVKLADLLTSADVKDITFFSFDYRSPSSPDRKSVV